MRVLRMLKSKIDKQCLISVDFTDLISEEADTDAILETQIVDCNLAKKEFDYLILELIYKDNKLFKVNEYYQGDIENVDLPEEHRSIKYSDKFPINEFNYLIESSSGEFKLFGNKSLQFQIPSSKENYTINYYGKISKALIQWLPFNEIEIFGPEFLQGVLFLDYSNPKQPKYINEEVIQKANHPDNGQGFTIKYFSESRFLTSKIEPYSEPLGFIGAPIWTHYPEIPRCPKTNKVMKFMLQIESQGRIHSQPGAYNYDPQVYIFMEPDSKIIGIVLQHT